MDKKDKKSSAYEAYLLARASGAAPHRLDGGAGTLFDAFAIALGVHHYFVCSPPVHFSVLEQMAIDACDGIADDNAPNVGVGPRCPPSATEAFEPSTGES